MRHRRCSSWRLWGSHILLLYMLHICPLSHYGCNNMCNQLWSIHTYIQSFGYFTLFFIIFHYFTLFVIIFIIISLLKVVHIQLWHCFDAVECIFYSFIHLFTFFLFKYLCCFIPVGFTDCLVCDTAFGMQHTKFLGGMCNLVRLGHLKSPLFTSNMFDVSVNNSSLYLLKLLIIVI